VVTDNKQTGSTPLDLRDKPHITPADIETLNFIRHPPRFVFRRHYRQGMRSHIMEVLDPVAVATEKKGVVSDGIKWYPRAKPLKMLRIFRTCFKAPAEAFEEIRKVRLIAKHLGVAYFANSVEFLVSYRIGARWDILLCGLQEYVSGVIIDPWGYLNAKRLAQNLARPGMGQSMPSAEAIGQMAGRIESSAALFIDKVKQMAYQGGYMPDLAGEGNLILTDGGDLKLVDINNISRVSFGTDIELDDKGYPVCDKSIEALSLLERYLAAAPSEPAERLYKVYLETGRMRTVAALEHQFAESIRQKPSNGKT
jgi:hypothetical protein